MFPTFNKIVFFNKATTKLQNVRFNFIHETKSDQTDKLADKVITKLYVPSTIKTQTKLVPFYFWADWAIRAKLKLF